MKKFVILLAFLIICLVQSTAYGYEIKKNTNNGDKVSIFSDIKISEETLGSVVAVKGNTVIEKDVHGDVVVVFGDTIY